MSFTVEVNQYEFDIHQTQSLAGQRLFECKHVTHVKYPVPVLMCPNMAFELNQRHYYEVREQLIAKVRESGCTDAIYFV